MIRFGALALMLIGCETTPAAIDMAPPDLIFVDKAMRCASTFGGNLSRGFGRLDGTVLAVVPPNHPSCPRRNDDHLVLQMTSGGAVYRMVVNIDVLYYEHAAALAGPPFSEGWHTTVDLDYTTLGVKKPQFTTEPIVERVTAQLALDAKVSVFASTDGGDSAHL